MYGSKIRHYIFSGVVLGAGFQLKVDISLRIMQNTPKNGDAAMSGETLKMNRGKSGESNKYAYSAGLYHQTGSIGAPSCSVRYIDLPLSILDLNCTHCIRGKLVIDWPEQGGFTLVTCAVLVLARQTHVLPNRPR